MNIQEDLENLESLKELLSHRKAHADYLLNVISSPGVAIDTTQSVVALTRVGWILNYTPTFATYNEITNSDRLSLIESVELKNNWQTINHRWKTTAVLKHRTNPD